MIRRSLVITTLIMLLSFMNICLASTITITPGYIDEDKKATELKITILHEQMNNEEFEAIAEDASEMMKNKLGKETIINVIKEFHKELGDFIKVDDMKMNVIIGALIQIRAAYVSTYENKQVTELFIFIKEDGRNIKLASYQIMTGATKLR